MTTTRTDIEQQVIIPTIGGEFDEATIEAITDEVLEAAPLSTWHLVEPTGLVSDAMDDETYWAIVERIASQA